MSGWVVLGIVLAVFVLIGCIPVGVDARYHENALALRLKIGFFTMQVLPAKPKKKKAEAKKKKPAAKKQDALLYVLHGNSLLLVAAVLISIIV